MASEHFDTEYTSLTGFGKRMLEKHGWKSGEGIGRKKDGRKDFVRIRKNVENAGIGKDKETTKPNYWWEKQYEQMLTKIDDNDNATTTATTTTSDKQKNVFKKSMTSVMKEVEVLANNKHMVYGGAFVRAATYVPTITEEKKKQTVQNSSSDSEDSSSSDSDDDDDNTDAPVKSKVLDPKMFDACEGRTLRKWTQDGKQKRLEQFDKQFKSQQQQQTGDKKRKEPEEPTRDTQERKIKRQRL